VGVNASWPDWDGRSGYVQNSTGSSGVTAARPTERGLNRVAARSRPVELSKNGNAMAIFWDLVYPTDYSCGDQDVKRLVAQGARRAVERSPETSSWSRLRSAADRHNTKAYVPRGHPCPC
jgi:hypothetical protein